MLGNASACEAVRVVSTCMFPQPPALVFQWRRVRPKLACSRPAPRLSKQALRSAARSPDLAALSDEILIGIYKEIYAQEIKMSVEEEGESILSRPLPHDLPHGRPPSLVTSLPP